MSTLEERREARRRRRQQEEEALVEEKARSLSRDDVKSAVDSRLAARRLERKYRRTESPQVNHNNEEENTDKRRRDRRESRLRQDQERGGDDSGAQEVVSTRRSRRRGGDEDETPAAPEPEPVEESAGPSDDVDNSAAEREAEERRRREQEEADAADAERQRQEEEDRKRRQEEEKRLQEERRKRNTPRQERQSRPKQRTPRGPLKTPRSSRQQKASLVALSERTIDEEEKKSSSILTPKTTATQESAEQNENAKTVIEKAEALTKVIYESNKRTETVQEKSKDLYAKIDVKSKVKALEAERNKQLGQNEGFSHSTKDIPEREDNRFEDQNDNKVGRFSPVGKEKSDTFPPASETSKTRQRSIQSSSDTDWDDRLTDIVASNRAMLSHDDTMERFTDFELGSCSSYDDIFHGKDQADVDEKQQEKLMTTEEFTPVFSLCEITPLVETSTHPTTTKQEDLSITDSSSEPHQLKSILKVKTHEERSRESSINRHKRSTAKERDLKRSSSRSRTRAPPRTPSETSSDDNDHFIPFTVDREDIIYNPEQRRASVIEKKNEKANNEASGKPLSPKTAPRIESMSENESMFSGDDVSSARNSVSLGTSVENLDSDYGELMSTNTTIVSTADYGSREHLVITPTPFEEAVTPGRIDDAGHFVSTAILISPGRKHKNEVDKVKDKENGDSDLSLESLQSSGFFGVKSDMPFNPKKKKMNARRSGKISQMTSIWSKMPDSEEDVHRERQSSEANPPRKIIIIRSARSDKEDEEMGEKESNDSATPQHKTIESRKSEIQQQLHQDEPKKSEIMINISKPDSDENEMEKPKYVPTTHEQSRRYSVEKKKELDELFGKLNSKLKSKDMDLNKKQYSDRPTPMFLAPFDSSVDAMQRSQSQPILNSTEDMEYYDPSQSVREYIMDDEPATLTAHAKNADLHTVDYPSDEGNTQDSQSSYSLQAPHVVQCSLGNNSPRMDSHRSNWSTRSNMDSGSDQDDYSDTDELEIENEPFYETHFHQGADCTSPKAKIKSGKTIKRKESAFSIQSNVSADCYENENNATNNTGYTIGDIPNEEEEVFEDRRRVQTEEWLQEDIGYRQTLFHRSSNMSTQSNADSTSVAAIDSLDGASGVDEDLYHHGYTDDRMSPGEINFSQNDDSDLKLPLHFLNDSSPDDEDESKGYNHENPDYAHVEEGEFDSDRCMDGSMSDPYDYSSEGYEEGLNSSRMVEYGDEYFEGEEQVDIMHSMNEMGEDIIQYLSDDMDGEGEAEEWGQEEFEGEEGNIDNEVHNHEEDNIVPFTPRDQTPETWQEGCIDGGIIYYTPNSGNIEGSENTRILHQTNEIQNQVCTDLMEEDEEIDVDEDDDIDGQKYVMVTESARRREMFKEHHGHIDDKDIVHSDNIPHGQELPDNDEFFISFEYDEDHRQGIFDYQDPDTEIRSPDTVTFPIAHITTENNCGSMPFDTMSHQKPPDNSISIIEKELFYDPPKQKTVETEELSPEFKHLRKQLLSELKNFNPITLRRASTEDEDECSTQTDNKLLDERQKIIQNELVSNQNSIVSGNLSQGDQLSQIERYIQGKQESSDRLHKANVNIIISQEQPLSSVDASKESTLAVIHSGREENSQLNKLTPDRTEFFSQRRKSSTSSQDGSVTTTVMNKERRKSIRSFWFQLDEDEKKQKETEENWRKKRDENRSRERPFVKPQAEQQKEHNTGKREKQLNVPERAEFLQQIKNSFEISNNDNAESSHFTRRNSYQLETSSSHNENETYIVSNGNHPSDKLTKKVPPAVAPKPDRARRRTTIGISFNANSETETPKSVAGIQAKTKSVKEIASFHNKLTEVLQEKTAVDSTKKFETTSSIKSSEFPSNKVTGSDSVQFTQLVSTRSNDFSSTTSCETAWSKSNESVPRKSSDVVEAKPVENVAKNVDEATKPVNLSREEKKRAKCQEVERVLIKRLSQKENMGESLQSPKQAKSVLVKDVVSQTNRNEPEIRSLARANLSELVESNRLKSSQGVHILPCVEQDSKVCRTSEINESTEKFSLKKTDFSNKISTNSTASPFSLNLPLNPPTLEEIDVSSTTDEPEDSKFSQNEITRKHLWLDPSADKDSTTGKPQAPRPRFNAKALATAQNAMPAFASKIDIQSRPISQQFSHTNLPLTLEKPHSTLATSAASSLGSNTSLDTTSDISSKSGELSSRDVGIKSWATDYLKDVISTDRHPRHAFELDSFGSKIASDTDSVNTSFSANSSFYGHMPTHSKHGDKGLSKEPKLSVAERVSKMQEKLDSSKESIKPPEPRNPTQSQQQFASLLQNRLIDVIAQEAEEDKKEKERERKKKKPKPLPVNSWAAERLKLFGPGKSSFKEETPWSPEFTSTPSTLSREPTKLKITVESSDTEGKTSEGNVEDAKNKLEDLSQSLSQTDVISMNKVRKREGRQYRRVTTGGIPFMEKREKFVGTDSSESSSESFGTPKEKTRPNSPWISSTGVYLPSPLVSEVINKLASTENTDVDISKSPAESRQPSIGRGRVAERIKDYSSRENSLPNSRSSSASRRGSQIISGTFDRKTVSELVKRVESSEESGTSLGSSLSFQPGELNIRSSDNRLVTENVRKLNTEFLSSSNSSLSNSIDRRSDTKLTTVNSQFSEKGFPNAENSVSPVSKTEEVCIRETCHRLSLAVSALSDLKSTNASKNKRMDKDRRHTTQINFDELRERYSSIGHPKDLSPPQSPAMHAIYASSISHIDSPNQFQTTKTETAKENVPVKSSAMDVSNRHSRVNEFTLALDHVAHSTPYPSIGGSKPVSARHNDFEDEVFSPLASARVPESLNLPSDIHPPPAFTFSARNFEDDICHGELAESESSDTVDFVKKRYEQRAAERHRAQEKQKQQQHPNHHIFHHPHTQQNVQPVKSNDSSDHSTPPFASTSSPNSTLEATAAARPFPSYPETVIDTRTATGHVRCRILSEIPLEPDESGIGASDNSLGSSTISVASVAPERISGTRSVSPPTSTITPPLSTTASNSNPVKQLHAATSNTIPVLHFPESIDRLTTDQLLVPQRKFSLGNESTYPVDGAKNDDSNLLSPRRASVHTIDRSTKHTDTHSSNASLSQESSRSTNEKLQPSNKHEGKRRKSKSKFMQDVLEKRRNKSEPHEENSSWSRKKNVYSASDAHGGDDKIGWRSSNTSNSKLSPGSVFGPTVGRKKSTGSPNEDGTANTLKGYSKRFDALWAKFDPDLQQKTDLEDSEQTRMQHDEEEQRQRQEEEERERERMEAEEAARVKAEEEEQKKKKKGKRKGLGGLSAEKKKLLKKLIMQRAAEELRNEAKQKAAEKEKYINDRVAPLKLDGLGQSELQSLVKDLHARVCTLEEDVYDWEIKIRKQDFEINELTLKVNDTKGKFIKPVLRKVNKTESKLKKIQQAKESTDFRGNLKSTGQNKYALEEDEGDKNNPHWRDDLKPKDEAEVES